MDCAFKVRKIWLRVGKVLMGILLCRKSGFIGLEGSVAKKVLAVGLKVLLLMLAAAFSLVGTGMQLVGQKQGFIADFHG